MPRGVAEATGPSLLEPARLAFAQAAGAVPDEPTHAAYAIAGRSVHIHTAGARLAEYVGRPFAHLIASGDLPEPELSIELWDEVATGVPGPHEDAALYGPEIPIPAGGTLALSPTGRVARHTAPGALTWYDRQAGRIVGWRKSAPDVRLPERTRPLARILTLWCLDQGIHLIHAGLVARDGCGILVVGPAGVGKSTVTLACAMAGFSVLGDDVTGLERLPDGPVLGHSLFSTVRLDPNHLLRFPDFCSQAVESGEADEPKSLLFLADIRPRQLPATVPIRAIVLPTVAPRAQAAWHPAPPREALRALGPGILWFAEPLHSLMALKHAAELAERVPCYHVHLGCDVNSIPDLLGRLLDASLSPTSA